MPNALTRVTTILASSTFAADATTTGSSVTIGFDDGSDRPVSGIVFVLDLTAAATASNDELDVVIQGQVDGTNWMPVATFAQLLGDGGTARRAIKIGNTTVNVTEFAYGTGVPTVMANAFRSVVTVGGAGASPSFTLSVVAVVM